MPRPTNSTPRLCLKVMPAWCKLKRITLLKLDHQEIREIYSKHRGVSPQMVEELINYRISIRNKLLKYTNRPEIVIQEAEVSGHAGQEDVDDPAAMNEVQVLDEPGPSQLEPVAGSSKQCMLDQRKNTASKGKIKEKR